MQVLELRTAVNPICCTPEEAILVDAETDFASIRSVSTLYLSNPAKGISSIPTSHAHNQDREHFASPDRDRRSMLSKVEQPNLSSGARPILNTPIASLTRHSRPLNHHILTQKKESRKSTPNRICSDPITPGASPLLLIIQALLSSLKLPLLITRSPYPSLSYPSPARPFHPQ